MGTQQILFVLLSVIIVGIAVSVGLYAFNQQAMSANRAAIIADMNYIASLSIAYYKVPRIQGGGEGEWISRENLYNWLNFETTPNGNRIVTENGQIKINVQLLGQKLTFVGYGYELGLDETRAVRAKLILKGPEADPILKFIN